MGDGRPAGMPTKPWVATTVGGVVLLAVGLSLLLNPQWRPWTEVATLWRTLASKGASGLAPVLLGVLAAVLGVGLVAHGTRRLTQAVAQAANRQAEGLRFVPPLTQAGEDGARLRIVGIGGGTGLSTLLRGLKAYPVDLTAIVTVTDDGGSSGRLRQDHDMPPPGDIRSCLVALAEAEPLMESLFEHRFLDGGGELNGHNLGNLIIAGLREMTGDFQRAIQEVGRVLAVRGRVLPSAGRALVLKAQMSDGGEVVGETTIGSYAGTVKRISIDPPDVPPLPEALEAIAEADVIVVGPGSIYTSLLPNLVICGMAEAIASAPAVKFFVCNVMTQPGESDGFDAARHLEAVLEQLPCKNPFRYAVVNLQRPPKHVLALYAEKGQHLVEPGLDRVRELGTTPVAGYLLADAHLARHDPDRLARTILERVAADSDSGVALFLALRARSQRAGHLSTAGRSAGPP